MGRLTPTGDDVEWLDGSEGPRRVSEEQVARGRSWVPLGLIVAVGLVAGALTLVSRTEDRQAPDPADSGQAERRRANALAGISLDFASGGSESTNALQGAIVDDLRGLARLDLALRTVLTSADGTEARLVAVSSAGDVLVAPLPQSSDFGFDASGAWLAGISAAGDDGERQVLWAGRIGSTPQPLAVGVESYAWHETAPGVLAWSEGDTGRLMTMALNDGGESLATIELPVDGRLDGWGAWGFALLTSDRTPTTAVLDPLARILHAALPGRFSGHLPGGELLLTGGAGEAIAYDPASGIGRTVSWLDGRDHVWSSSLSDARPEAVVLVGRDGVRTDPFRGEVTLVGADETAEILALTAAITDVAWSHDRELVVFADQQVSEPGLPGRIRTIAHDGRVDAVLVPDLFDGLEWVAALSVR